MPDVRDSLAYLTSVAPPGVFAAPSTVQDSTAYFNANLPTAAADPNAPVVVPPQASAPPAPDIGPGWQQRYPQAQSMQDVPGVREWNQWASRRPQPVAVQQPNVGVGQSIDYFRQQRWTDLQNYGHDLAAKEVAAGTDTMAPAYRRAVAEQIAKTFPGTNPNDAQDFLDSVRQAHQQAFESQQAAAGQMPGGEVLARGADPSLLARAETYFPTDALKQKAAAFWQTDPDKLKPADIANYQQNAAGIETARQNQLALGLKNTKAFGILPTGELVTTPIVGDVYSAATNFAANTVGKALRIGTFGLAGGASDTLNQAGGSLKQVATGADVKAGVPAWVSQQIQNLTETGAGIALGGAVGSAAGGFTRLATAGEFGTTMWNDALARNHAEGVTGARAQLSAVASGIIGGGAIAAGELVGAPGSFGRAAAVGVGGVAAGRAPTEIKSLATELAGGAYSTKQLARLATMERFGKEVMGNMGIFTTQHVGQALVDYATTGDKGKIEPNNLFNGILESAITGALLPIAMHGAGEARDAAAGLLDRYRDWRSKGNVGVPPRERAKAGRNFQGGARAGQATRSASHVAGGDGRPPVGATPERQRRCHPGEARGRRRWIHSSVPRPRRLPHHVDRRLQAMDGGRTREITETHGGGQCTGSKRE